MSRVLLLDYLPAQIGENLINVHPPPSRGLVVGFGAPALRDLERIGSLDNSVFLHVAFVADHYKRDIFIVLDAYDLFSKL